MLEDIYKNRSCYSCINAALNILSKNFSKVFRSTWIGAIIASLLFGILAFVNPQSFVETSVLGIIIYILLLLVVAIIGITTDSYNKAKVLSMLEIGSFIDDLKKIAKINTVFVTLFLCFCVAAMLGLMWMGQLVFAKYSVTTSIGIMLCTVFVVTVAIAALCSPFIYSVTKFIVDPNSKLKNVIGKNYHIGIKRIGFLFSITVVFTLFFIVACMFLVSPAIITNIASSVDSYGVAMGDVSGLPHYFSWLNFLATSLMAFIFQYILFWTMFVNCYAYGNIETDIKKQQE